MSTDPEAGMAEWPGRCKTCHIVWWWPKDGHKYGEDLKKEPRCLECTRVLTRTTDTSNDEYRETTRAAVGLEGEHQLPLSQ